MASKSYLVNPGIDCCPTEILCFILKLVDAKTFLNCRRVCRRWKGIVDDIGEDNSLWERFIKEEYLDVYPSLYRKSVMPCYNMYKNIKLWQKVENTTETKILNFTYNFVKILKVRVYKDKVIVVCTRGIKYYMMPDFTFIRTIKRSCVDWQESDEMILILQKDRTIRLYGKSAQSTIFDNPKPFDENQLDIVCYSLEDDSCYYVNQQRTLWACTFRQNEWTQTFLAKDYGTVPILSINVWRDTVYMLLQNGKIYQAVPNMKQFVRVCSTITPTCIKNGYLFNKYDVLFSVSLHEDSVVRKCHDHINMKVPDISCVLVHGEMLVLGLDNNLIEIYSTKEMEFPKRRTVLSRTKGCLEYVLAMDIYESQDKHTIIAATNFTIHVIAYTYLPEMA